MSNNQSKEVAVSGASPDPEERRRKYNRAVRQANLVTILLSKIDFKVNREIKRPVKSDERKSTPSYGGKLVKFQFNEEAKAFIASVAWTVELKVGRQTYSKCVAHYDVIYNGFSDIDEEIVELFAENVARPATYTYFRALFASLDWSAELRLPPLPVIKFHPKV